MHELRNTMISGLPAELEEELSGLVGALIPTPEGARYRLERVLGRGALFVTFRATRIDPSGAVPHAFKVLRPSLARAWPAGAKLLSREQARVLAILNDRVPPSPHVVRILEIGELPLDPARGVELAVPWFALEAIDAGTPRGASLFHHVRESVATTGVGLSPRRALELLRGAARGLDWIHQHGLLHRGLSPANVLVSGVGARALAKISDVAIARPAGLPATFGLGGDDAYRAPEQRAPDAVLGPSCDVHAFAGLVRFVLTGRAPADGEPPLSESRTLHPAIDRSRDAASLAALDGAIFLSRALDPDARPPTAESAWSSFEPPLRALAERADAWAPGVSSTGRRIAANAPARAAAASPALVWTERHRPARPRRFARVAADEGGHALAIEDGAPWWFDGRAFRVLPVGLAATAVARSAPGSFAVGGRTRGGGARVVRVSSDGVEALFEGDGAVVALAASEQHTLAAVQSASGLALIDARGRVQLEGVSSIEAIAPLGDRSWLLVGESSGGAPWLAVFDAETRRARPQPSPRSTRLLSAAAGGGGDGAEAWVVGAHGTALLVQPVAGAVPRLRTAREQLATHDDVTAVALDEAGVPWAAAGPALYRRDSVAGAWVSVFRDDDVAAPIVALLPRRGSVQAFVADGSVLEGRTLGA